jgi:hypothetical protein
LLQDNTDGLFNVDEETPGRGALFIMGHASRTGMHVVLERRCSFGIVSMEI